MARRLGFPVLLAVLLLLASPVLAAEEPLAECWQGLSADNALWQECPLGDYVADGVRTGAGTQIALIPAELLGSALVGDGTVTLEELEASLPVDCGIVVAELSGQELTSLLEAGAARWTLTERETLDPKASAYGGYLQISGFSVTMDASAPAGERVVSVTLAGETLDLRDGNRTVTAALPETLGVSGTPADQSLRQMLRDYLLSSPGVELPEGDRVRVIGAHQRELISYVPPGLLAIVLVLVILAGGLSLSRRPTK